MDAPLNGLFFHDIENSYLQEILKEVYKDKIYEQFIPKDKKGTVAIEVGANVGAVTHYLAKRFDRVYALEPSLMHYEALTTMVEFNDLKNVTPLKIALSNKNGEADFYHHENVTMFSLRPEVNSKPDEMERVVTIDFETLLKEQKIDEVTFCKLDCEGSEYDILSSEAFEKVAPKIKTIVTEFHQWNGVNYNQIINLLKDMGYEIRQIPSEATIFAATR